MGLHPSYCVAVAREGRLVKGSTAMEASQPRCRLSAFKWYAFVRGTRPYVLHLEQMRNDHFTSDMTRTVPANRITKPTSCSHRKEVPNTAKSNAHTTIVRTLSSTMRWEALNDCVIDTPNQLKKAMLRTLPPVAKSNGLHRGRE